MQNKLYVGNLSYAATEEQVRELFAAHGEVTSVKVIGNKGFGFVEMADQVAAEKAKSALNGQQFLGRSIKVDEARPPREGGGGGGYGRSGGGGGGYGRSGGGGGGYGRRF